MAHEYALVHLKYTIPLALLLTILAYPIIHRIQLLQVGSIVLVAFLATLPWDAYLIAHNVWTYPPEAIFGPRLWGIPIEELFFFVIQTYITSLMYILLNKPLLHVLYLKTQRTPPRWMAVAKAGGQAILVALTLFGAHLVGDGGRGTYLGLILAWACPFALLTWTVAGRFILSLPWYATVLPIMAPTAFLWLVDELALGRGTWSIESGTKLELCLFGVLDIEEATFFLLTNALIVFGLATFDQYLAIIYAFPDLFPAIPRYPTPLMMVQSRLLDSSRFDFDRIAGIEDAVQRLRKKSRSFYLANSLFAGRLRIDLITLYSFCRFADDLVDNASSEAEVLSWTSKLTKFLDICYEKTTSQASIDNYINTQFPASANPSLRLLPTTILPSSPLYLLIAGFKTDAQFTTLESKPSMSCFPIADEPALVRYAECVAGTVGELCVSLILHHCAPPTMAPSRRIALHTAARQMGIALQYVNIARDIGVDARIGRVYIPTTWLKEEGPGEAGLTPQDVLESPRGPAVERLRRRLLFRALELYKEARPSMRWIPAEARGPMVAAVETYMEIGRVLLEKGECDMPEGKATVPPLRRGRTALAALFGC